MLRNVVETNVIPAIAPTAGAVRVMERSASRDASRPGSRNLPASAAVPHSRMGAVSTSPSPSSGWVRMWMNGDSSITPSTRAMSMITGPMTMGQENRRILTLRPPRSATTGSCRPVFSAGSSAAPTPTSREVATIRSARSQGQWTSAPGLSAPTSSRSTGMESTLPRTAPTAPIMSPWMSSTRRRCAGAAPVADSRPMSRVWRRAATAKMGVTTAMMTSSANVSTTQFTIASRSISDRNTSGATYGSVSSCPPVKVR